jgi:hypothetical protein
MSEKKVGDHPARLLEESESTNSVEKEDAPIPFFIQYDYQQAVKLGFLREVSDMAQQFGFSLPVALTQKVWHSCVACHQPSVAKKIIEDQRLVNVLGSAAAAYFTSERIYKPYVVYTLQGQDVVQVELTIYTSPGHAFAKTITIMMADEK